MKKIPFVILFVWLSSLTLFAQNKNILTPYKLPEKAQAQILNPKPILPDTLAQICVETVEKEPIKPKPSPIIGGFLGFLLFEPNFLHQQSNSNNQIQHLERGNS